MKHRRTSLPRAQAQRGAAGIEFAFLFTIFFGVFYAILSYAFVTLLLQGLIQAAAEGARGAVRVDRTAFVSEAQYKTACETLAKDAVVTALSWLPAAVRTQIEGSNGITYEWVDKNVPVTTGNGSESVGTLTLTVRVTYANYAARPLLPLLTLPGLGTIPNVPTNLVGTSTLRVTK
jgi:Flp pilus assembly protein TadG